MKEYYLVPAHEIDKVHADKQNLGDISKDKQLFDNDHITKADVIELHNQINKLRRENESSDRGSAHQPYLKHTPLRSTSTIHENNNPSNQNDNKVGNLPVTKHENNSTVKSEGNRTDNAIAHSQDNKTSDEILEKYLWVVPKGYIAYVRNFIKLVLARKNVELDRFGNIILVSSGKKVPLIDFLRGLFVRNAKVSHIKDFLKEMFHTVGDIVHKQGSKFIRNEKVFDLLTEIEQKEEVSSEEQTLSDMEEDSNLSLKGGKLSKIHSIPWIRH